MLIPWAKIRVFNDNGFDTETIIVWTEEELMAEVKRLRKSGYRVYRDNKPPTRVYRVE